MPRNYDTKDSNQAPDLNFNSEVTRSPRRLHVNFVYHVDCETVAASTQRNYGLLRWRLLGAIPPIPHNYRTPRPPRMDEFNSRRTILLKKAV
jgi:hypothetical protein